MRFISPLSIALLLLAPRGDAHGDEPALDHERAVAEIRRRGGEVLVRPGPDQPSVRVVLTGAKKPAECLPYLKHVNNLQSCDL